MMGDELYLSPEITVHEEPGHITINNMDEVSVEIDDDEPSFPFANGDIPAEISITKVNKQRANGGGGGQQRPMLKVRNDLAVQPHFGMQQQQHHQPQVRPPPLMKRGGGLPPMPRLRFGGPRVQRSPNPLAGMMNMQHQMPHRMPMRGGMRPTRPSSHRPPMMSPQFNGGNGVRGGMHGMMGNGYPVRMGNRPMATPPAAVGGFHQQRTVNRHQMMSKVSPGMGKMPQGMRHSPNGAGGPPPMMRAGMMQPPPRSSPQMRSAGNNVQVRTVFVPPPMKMSQSQQQRHWENRQRMQMMAAAANGAQQHQQQMEENEEEIDDEEEDTILDEEELDDVEPDVDPGTNEVDDVEPMDVMRQQQALIRKIDKHQVTVSITPKSSASSVSKPSIPAMADVSITTTTASSASSPTVGKVQYVRRPDGKGFMRKIVSTQGQRILKKKKKKKPFRGINYRFDGSRIKKKAGVKRPQSHGGSESPTDLGNGEMVEENGAEERDPAFLEYLGIQRKEDGEPVFREEEVAAAAAFNNVAMGNKAKKSFRPGPMVSRNSSNDDASSMDSLKRRLSLSEVLNTQKKMRPDQQAVRNSFGGNTAVRNTVDGKPEEEELPKALPRLRHRKTPEPDPALPLPQPLVCECAKENEQLVKGERKPGVAAYCQGVESVGGNKVGCTNKVEDFLLRGPGQEAKGKLLCKVHVQRIKGHHMCPYCGEFCAHGIFLMCRPMKKSPPHFFHKSCFSKVEKSLQKCPHCHSPEQPLTVQLKLKMTKAPLKLLQVASKMSFPKPKAKTEGSKADQILEREGVVTYKMPNGKIISSEGLPQGIENSKLEEVLTALEDKQSLKHATRNMYVPVKSGDNVKMMQLLSLGYSPNQRFPEAEGGTPLHVAATEGHVLTMHILVQAGAELDTLDEEQNTALMLACIKGKSECVRYLLQSGADMTLRGDDGMTCLHLATQSGFLECAHIILNQTHLPRNFMNMQDEGGWTPLVWACENKHEAVINYLIGRGADPLITDAEGNIALHWAALSGSRSTCEVLLNSGCDVNVTNNLGETPMHIVLRQDHYECAMLFLMRNARLDIRNKNKLTPVECMVSNDVESRVLIKLSTTLHSMMKDAKTARSERIVCNDLTRAKESNPIQCVNNVDDANEPSGYVYVSKSCVTNSVPLDRNISKLQHCKCTDTCSSEDSCHCSDLSVKSWYDMQGRLKEGFDYKDPPMIFECNEMCQCNVSLCFNRVIQHGITSRLQVFRTEGMGWGLRAAADIAKGSFVCEYVGEIISDSEADTREDSYLFDLDNRDGDTFCIDANKYGNIARFINHSCSPNVVPVKVFSYHQDLRFPHIALFATKDIPKGTELGFDYGEKFWVIKHKYFTCHCGYDKCRYNKSSILGFLREYYNRIGEPMPDDIKPPQAAAAAAAAATAAATTLNGNNQENAQASAKAEAAKATKAEPEEKKPVETKKEEKAAKKPDVPEPPPSSNGKDNDDTKSKSSRASSPTESLLSSKGDDDKATTKPRGRTRRAKKGDETAEKAK